MQKFPVLISIPHGGNSIPDELKSKIIIGKKEIFEDIDPFTHQIYDLKNKVTVVLKNKIARTFVDLNRSPDDLPPRNPDGVVKSHTCFGKIIYKEHQEPEKTLTNSLLKKFYYPYHEQIEETIRLNKSNLKICLDCHSMAEIGPAIAPDSGVKRPMICLGNRFGDSASHELIQKLRLSFIKVFNLDKSEVTINKPFAGGYITRHHGNNPLSWIQVEMNRSFYLKTPYFDSASQSISDDILKELNNKFFLTLKNFFS